jgi:hypothetical protein
MRQKIKLFVYRNLYFMWGVFVVGVVTIITGSLISSLLGYTFSVGAIALFERLL